MNKLIVTLLAAATLTTAQAQHKPAQFTKQGRRAFVNSLIREQQQRSAAKATAIYWRVAASSAYAGTGSSLSIEDSVKYKYANDRGSSFNFGDLSYYDYGLSTMVKYDTALRMRDNGSGLQPAGKSSLQYNSGNNAVSNIEQQHNGSQFENSLRSEAVRDGNGNITREVSMNWNSADNAWDTSMVAVKKYNSQNKIVLDSAYITFMGMSVPAFKVAYTYNTDGTLNQVIFDSWDFTNMAWIPGGRTTMTYNTGKMVVKSLSEDYVNSAWRNNDLDTMGYDANGVYNYYENRSWDTANNVWENVDKEIHTINSKGLPSSILFAEWDGSAWDNYSQSDLVYDTYDNVTRENSYDINGGVKDPNPSYVNNYYYEVHFGVSVHDKTLAKQVKTYPNPATTVLTVVTESLKGAELVLTNMAGQQVRKVQAGENNAATTISVAGLPAGNYILNVITRDNAPAQKMVVVQ